MKKKKESVTIYIFVCLYLGWVELKKPDYSEAENPSVGIF